MPIRLLANKDANTIHNATRQAFLSLFKINMDFDYYKKSFKTISDIKNNLFPDIEKNIVFSEDDDISLDFETRFKNYKESSVLPLKSDATDAEIFAFCLYGYFSQAFDIVMMCAEYELIPYIRFEVAFKYILKISSIFGDNKELINMIFKCAIAHVIHHTFNKENFCKIDFHEYCEMIQIFDFENQLFSDLHQENISFYNPSLTKVKSIINKNFESMLLKHDMKK